MRWQKFGSKPVSTLVKTPQQKQLSQLGLRQETVVPLTTSYEFYGGESTVGNNIPYSMISDAQGNTYFKLKLVPVGKIGLEAYLVYLIVNLVFSPELIIEFLQ